jgi:hypothetical protein
MAQLQAQPAVSPRVKSLLPLTKRRPTTALFTAISDASKALAGARSGQGLCGDGAGLCDAYRDVMAQ